MDWSEDGQLLAVSTTKVHESRDQVGLDNMDCSEDGPPSQQPRYESRDLVGLDNMNWSEDRQLLAVSTTKVRVT